MTSIALVAILAIGFGFLRYGYRLGFAPTAFALGRMSDEEKALALVKVPTGELATAELPTEQKRAENKQSVDVLSAGVPERIANLEPVAGKEASGMVRIVSAGDKLYLVFDESVSIAQAPTLRVYLSKRASGSFDDYRDAYADLGELKSARGTQVYDIPKEFTLGDIKSIAIVNVPYRAIVARAVID